jgi:hypothetical protein
VMDLVISQAAVQWRIPPPKSFTGKVPQMKVGNWCVSKEKLLRPNQTCAPGHFLEGGGGGLAKTCW